MFLHVLAKRFECHGLKISHDTNCRKPGQKYGFESGVLFRTSGSGDVGGFLRIGDVSFSGRMFQWGDKVASPQLTVQSEDVRF